MGHFEAGYSEVPKWYSSARILYVNRSKDVKISLEVGGPDEGIGHSVWVYTADCTYNIWIVYPSSFLEQQRLDSVNLKPIIWSWHP